MTYEDGQLDNPGGCHATSGNAEAFGFGRSPKPPSGRTLSTPATATPPTFLTVSEKAQKLAETAKCPCYYFSVKKGLKNLKDNTRSRLDVSDITYNAALPDAVFTPQHLLR